MTLFEIVRDLTKPQTVTVLIRGLDFTQPPAAEIEIQIEPEEAEEMATFSTSIAASSDDAAQIGSTVTLTDTSIAFYWTDYYGGLRFQNVTIPAGATVTNAYITLTTTGAANDSPGGLTITANDVDDATTFTTTSNDISSRAKTTASVSWPGADIGTGAKNSPDLKTVIQEIIDRGSWASGNDIAILLQGGSSSSFAYYSYDSGSNYPSITIDYTTSSSGTNPKTAGIRLTTKVGGTLTR